MLKIEGKYTTAKIFIDEIDDTTYSQIVQLVNHPAFTEQVCIMPDTHAGASNSVIGFTMPLTDKIIPNTVGVDIGCGMVAVKTNLQKKDLNFPLIDEKIRRYIPIGNSKIGIHFSPVVNFEKYFPFEKANETLYKFNKSYNKKFGTNYPLIEYNYNWLKKLCNRIGTNISYIEQSLGTLGGGNHFIEIGESSADKSIWIVIHSGSRYLGKKIADFHSKIAFENLTFDKKSFEKEFEELKKEYVKKEKSIKALKKQLTLKYSKNIDFPKTMCYLTGDDMYNYLTDMIFAQIYAQTNRQLMIKRIAEKLKIDYSEKIESVHNYIDFDDLIIRKGAIRAYKGEKMIIPFNMADGILICEGKSNKEWNYSAPHGAGRVMSRSKAKQSLNVDEFKNIMQSRGIFTTSATKQTLDEAPQVYKNAKIIEKAISPTAKIIFKLKPLYNLKGA